MDNLIEYDAFLCYAKEDFQEAQRVYFDLLSYNINVWMNEKFLLPGQKWQSIVKNSMRKCEFFLLLFSSKSSNKGNKLRYFNSEINEAIRKYKKCNDEDIYIIPVRIDECDFPNFDEIKDLYYANLFPSWDDGIKKIVKAIRSKTPDKNLTCWIPSNSF